MRESKIEKYLRDLCKKEGFGYYKFTSPSTSGVPDRILITPKRTVFVELKATGKTMRALQIEIVKQMEKEGAIVYKNIDSFEKCDNIIRKEKELIERKTYG